MGVQGNEPPLVEELLGLKLILGTFNSLSLLFSPALRRLYYLAHFTDVESVAQKGLNDLSEFSQPASGTATSV